MVFTGLPLWGIAAMGVASAGLLAALHLLRVRPQELRVVTLLFWEHATERTQARSLLERFRHPLTYLLLLSIALLMVLALGHPERSGDASRRAHRVIIIDAGRSMAVREGAGGALRLDAARRQALAEIEQVAGADRVALVAAAETPRLLSGYDDPRPAIREALQQLQPGAKASDPEAAIRLGASLLHGRSSPELVLITDREPLSPSTVDSGIDLRVIRVGTPNSEASLVCVTFTPGAQDPLTGRLVIRAVYNGPEARDVTVHARRQGGAPLLSQVQRMSPGEAKEFVIDTVPADGDTLAIEAVAGPVASGTEPVLFPLPLRSPIRVSVTASIPAGVMLALRSDPAIRVVEPSSKADVAVLLDPATAPPGAAMILRTQGAAGVGVRPVTVSSHPLLRSLGWEDAACSNGPALGAPDGTATLLGCGAAPVAVISGKPSRQQFEMSSALFADAAITQRAAFPIFVSRCVRRLAGWDEDPIVLAPLRASRDPLWTQRSALAGKVVVMPAEREPARAVATGASVAPAPGRNTWSGPLMFEWLLLLALGGLLVEAFLHLRGRIA